MAATQHVDELASCDKTRVTHTPMGTSILGACFNFLVSMLNILDRGIEDMIGIRSGGMQNVKVHARLYQPPSVQIM